MIPLRDIQLFAGLFFAQLNFLLMELDNEVIILMAKK